MDLSPFLKAAQGKQWILLTALTVNVVIASAKQGWLSAWIAARLTPRNTPFYVLGLSVVSTVSTDIVRGMPWQSAILNGVSAAFAAIAAHQVVIESLRDGKEVIPATPKVNFARSLAVLKPFHPSNTNHIPKGPTP